MGKGQKLRYSGCSLLSGEKENNMADDMILIDERSIKDKIYTIRGVQVMYDSDLAIMYGIETKFLNRAMKRNIDRFPETFCFQVTKEEYLSSRCQNGTLKVFSWRVKYFPQFSRI